MSFPHGKKWLLERDLSKSRGALISGKIDVIMAKDTRLVKHKGWEIHHLWNAIMTPLIVSFRIFYDRWKLLIAYFGIKIQ